MTRARWRTLARVAFVVLAVGLAVVALWRDGAAVADAASRLAPGLVAAAAAASVANVLTAMLAWRAVLADLGSPLPVRPAARVYLLGQLGKYVPGSVWQVVAAAELGREHGVPRTRSAGALAVALLITVTTAVLLALGVPVLVADEPGWALPAGLAAAFVLVGLLHPAVLNRVLGLGLRLVRQPALEHVTSLRGTVGAAGWALVSWAAVGVQVWVLAVAVGAPATAATLALCVVGFAAAWVAGFVVLVAPAGVGVREVVLALLLASVLARPEVLVVVVASRVLLTGADLALAGVAVLVERRRRPPRQAPLGSGESFAG